MAWYPSDIEKSLIKSDTFTGTTTANGNIMVPNDKGLNVNNTIIVFAQITSLADSICIPYDYSGNTNWGFHCMSSTSALTAITSTEVTIKYYYIER